jgi:hypothetical protein
VKEKVLLPGAIRPVQEGEYVVFVLDGPDGTAAALGSIHWSLTSYYGGDMIRDVGDIIHEATVGLLERAERDLDEMEAAKNN